MICRNSTTRAARGISVMGEVELAAPYLLGKTIGITGSNGKTTTTAMVGHILDSARIPCQVGGNIGTPLTAMVGTSRQDKWNVLELSSFQLETVKRFRADVAVCLNVTQNHLDRHHTFGAYAAAKGNLFPIAEAGRLRGAQSGRSAVPIVCESHAGREGMVWVRMAQKW